MAARTCSTSSGGTELRPWSATACAATSDRTASSSGPVNVVVQPGTTSPQAKVFMRAPVLDRWGDRGRVHGPRGSGGGGRGGQVLDPQDPQDVALTIGAQHRV